MRWLALVALVGCSSASSTKPTTTVAAPPPPTPMCTGDECSAPLEKEPRFEPPNPDEFRPPDEPGTLAETADCKVVGEVLASTEVGNYAEPEERAPVVAKHTATCESLKLDQATRTCIAEQGDKMSIAYCAPEIVPDTKLEIVAATECDAIVKSANDRLATRAAYDWEKKWWTPRANAFLASCKKDRWTKQIGDCVKNGQAQYCAQYQAVRPLQTKLDAMLVEANKQENERISLWHKAYAEPKKYPQVKLDIVKAGACADIMKAVNVRIEKQGPSSWEKTWWTPRAKAYLASCKKDRWTAEVADCVKTMYPGNCYQYAPQGLQQKMIQLYQQALPTLPPPHRKRQPVAPKQPAPKPAK
jgi:hypothetical protein